MRSIDPPPPRPGMEADGTPVGHQPFMPPPPWGCVRLKLSFTSPHPGYLVVAVDVPDTASTYEPNIDSLPERWDEVPVSSAAQAFGRRWLDEARQLCLKIPSVIVPEEKNVVINPRHPEYPNVQLTVIRPFSFDPRMHK